MPSSSAWTKIKRRKAIESGLIEETHKISGERKNWEEKICFQHGKPHFLRKNSSARLISCTH